ncbi:MAG TPA: CHAT domain-containing tetratricopeptide repeat protein [Thermoanaerobaculia bacterium]|jgi:CHAT domain-containing protein|nr:CHAT domain-containing tetratricopeptide repeat protein [Thermoanaerobaculia bacterium]
MEGKPHAWLISMEPGRFADVTVEQKGVDVAVSLRGPDGKVRASIDSPNGSRGPEPIPFLADSAGTYRLEIKASGEGLYAVRIGDVRPATAADRIRIQAERLLSEGEALRLKEDRASLVQAAERARQAERLFRSLDLSGRQADALVSQGESLYALDDFAGSEAAYGKALPLFRKAGRELDAGKSLNAMGRVQHDPERALELYREALDLNRRLGDREQEAVTLHNLGQAWLRLGETEKALASYEQALPVWRSLGKRYDEAGTLVKLGYLYQSVGEPARAIDLLPKALAIFESLGADRDAAGTLNALGNAQAKAGELEPALASLDRALAIRRRLGDRRGEGETLNDVGWCQILQGRPEKARASFGAAVAAFREVRDEPSGAMALSNQGWADEELGRARPALDAFNRALPVLGSAGLREREAMALLGIARARRSLGDLPAARKAAEDALSRIESLRGKPASLGMRASYLATKQTYYEVYSDLLVQLGEEAKALGVNEEARARSLLEMLSETGAAVDPKLRAREAELGERINRADARRRSLSGKEAELADAEVSELLRQQDRVQAEIRLARSPAAPRPLTLPEIQREVVDDGTILLEYGLGKERSFLWVVTPDSLSTFVLPPRARIEQTARRAAELLAVSHQTMAKAESEATLARLSQELLGPAAALLGDRRLLIVPDGALHYLPFAAFPDPAGGAPLVARHEIVTLPSASSLAALRKEHSQMPTGTLAVIADPSPSPPLPGRGTRADRERGPGGEGSLPYAREEAEALLAMAPPDRRLGALGPDANRQTVLSGRLSNYRLVHFATHGILDTAHPELSRLVLSGGDLLSHEVYRLRLPADLVVLSACRTALGKEIRGEGLVGLTRGFFQAGARSVVVSLWEVEDRATAELMLRFYREMLEKGRPPAAALRAAQDSLRKEPGWEAPYFWAGFVLQGDWQPRR